MLRVPIAALCLLVGTALAAASTAAARDRWWAPGSGDILPRSLSYADDGVVVLRPPPPGPYVSRDWHIEFNFQSNFLAYQYSEVILDEAARYIRAGGARRVEVVGYADSKPYMVSGRTLIEPRGLAEDRARMVNQALLRLGVNPAILHIDWHDDPAAIGTDDGMAEPSKRRVTIHVEM
jgi:outer membrane protein OmpA-like peptidoglycan-associated protein